MPSTSKNQQIAAAIALKAKKEGKKPEAGTASAQMAKMSQEDLEKFARTKHKGLPKKKRKKVQEAWGQKLETYIQIIWRWFEHEGYPDFEIETILNDPDNIDTIESAEAHGINPILVAKDLKTENIEAVHESFQPVTENEVSDIFYNEFLPNEGFFLNKFTYRTDIDINDPEAGRKIIDRFSKFLEEEYYEMWDPALENTEYKDIVDEFIHSYKVRESYSPVTIEEFLNESQED